MKRYGVAILLTGLLAVPSMAQTSEPMTLDQMLKSVSGTLCIHLDAALGVTADANGKVTKWSDQIYLSNAPAFGMDFIVPTLSGNSVPNTATGPTLVQNGINNLPMIRFDGVSNVLQGGGNPPALGLDWTVFFVLANVTDTRGLMDGAPGSTNQFRFSRTNRVQNQSWDNGGVPFTLPADTSTGMILSFSHHGDTVTDSRTWNVVVGDIGDQSYENFAGAEGQRAVTWNKPQLGAFVDVQGGNWNYHFFKGDIAEVLIFQGAMSAADMMTVNSYLMSKYSVPEPATMSVLAMGGLALLRRWK